MTRRAATVLVSLILSWPVLFCASYAQQLVVIRGGTLIDGNGGPPLRNATVLIEKICDFGIAERSTVDSDLIHQTAEVLADFVGTRA